MQVGETAEVFEIDVAPNAPVAGHTIADAAESGLLSDDAFVVAIERPESESPVVPRGNTTIQAGDRVTVYAASGATDEVTEAFGGETD
ncbi:MAG: TrkA C-terminal domain-containing protein, partial [Haloplanus sp.]